MSPPTTGGPETVIHVAERSQRSDGAFVTRVSFGDATEFEVVLTDPAEPGDEERFAWYFEEHLRFPFLDRDLAEDAEQRLRAYGERLFGQVFTGEAMTHYRALARRGFDGCRLQVQGSAAFHRLHWEALCDPALRVPSVLRLPVTRRVDLPSVGFELPPPPSTLNILVVTARPNGPADVGYRTISRPLMDGLRRAERPVVVDLVRPGTWPALQRHLRWKTKLHGSGHYQVIHFDVHGAVTDFAELTRSRTADRYTFSGYTFASAPTAFAGQRAFLFFETAQDGRAEAVPAQDVADLLAEHRVPVAVLNACQSAKEPVSEASLAQRLVAAGVPVAIGMAYSVTVSAAQLAMPLLYAALTQGDDLVDAVQAARRSLFDAKGRQAYFDQQLDLEDWVLPVFFHQRDVRLALAEMSVEQENRFLEYEARVRDEPRPEYGFIGRDLDVLAIERRLLIHDDRNVLLVRGMVGAGKTTLLRHLGWWWQRTGLVEMVFWFSYESRAWTVDEIVESIAADLLGRAERYRWEELTTTARTERIVRLLRARRYLLVLDNVESVTATPAAIPHALAEADRHRLADFLGALPGGRTLVLVGSREDERWLAARTFGDNTYLLPGLDEQAASVLVEAVLNRHGGAHHLRDQTQRQALEELRGLLGGYPLPLTVVLPTMATHSPTQVLADLRQGIPDADPYGLISTAIAYSHGKLDPATQHALLLLAPFTGSIPVTMLGAYRGRLDTDEAVRALGPVDLDAAVAEAVRVGLATPHPRHPRWVQILPVLPYFLRTRLREHPGVEAATRQAHYRLYTVLAGKIHGMLVATRPSLRRSGELRAEIDYANLRGALSHGLATGQPVQQIVWAMEEYLDQNKQQESRRHLLDLVLAARRDAVGELRRDLSTVHYLIGGLAHGQRRYADAREHYRQALAILGEFDDEKESARIVHHLGMVAQSERRFDQAERHFRAALAGFLRFDPASAGFSYHHLGMLAHERGHLDQANEHLQAALGSFLAGHNRHKAGYAHHGLGIVAQEQGRHTEAADHYRQALEILQAYQDSHGAANTRYQLGTLAQTRDRLDESVGHYREALVAFRAVADHKGIADTYYQLGTVAQRQQRYDQAESHYEQALTGYQEIHDRISLADTHYRLGTLAQQRGRPGAEECYRTALRLYHEAGHPAGVTATTHRLAQLALEQPSAEGTETAPTSGAEPNG
ncbi:tetratricopeptide repeat protein [Micromonospora yangpuensis]|uniref:Tetratricopeptide repeat-containing protein n=1 Tax=Micromonospora yangpuensis TaxID=683228 RepID=A0A1C6V087_9ACTN|nr:tetratricopeptide repeat protein [Micromonospora yangpuensis]GGL96742.1 hypothetical protein GCM10012279_12790 [Micromonospora yangpuensis]SCL59718.1 Tetratricopeptide repeat-containing protein [Micromonospora yangpuensis]